MKTLITFTDGGSREIIQRSILKTIQSEFQYMVAVGVGPQARDEELRLLSTKGRSIHVKDYDGEPYLAFSRKEKWRKCEIFLCVKLKFSGVIAYGLIRKKLY